MYDSPEEGPVSDIAFYQLFRSLVLLLQLAIDQQTVGSLVVNDKSIADLTALEIGKVGENIAVRRATYLCAASEKQLIASYVHSTGRLFCAQIALSRQSCCLFNVCTVEVWHRICFVAS